MMGAASQDPRFCSGIHIRLWCPEIGRNGKLWHGLFHLLAVYIIDDHTEPVAEIYKGYCYTASFLGGKYQSCRILSVTHA